MERKNDENFDCVKLRLLEFAENQQIPKYKFYKKISTAPSNFGGKSMESSFLSSKIIEVLTIFPSLSPDWLLLGKGPMLRQDEPQATATIPSSLPDPTALTIIKRNEELVRENERLRAELEHWKKATHTPVRETADVSTY